MYNGVGFVKKVKIIKFDYGRIYWYELIHKGSETFKSRKVLKLENLLKIALNKTIKERTKDYHGEDIIMQDVKKINEDLWQMQFVKQRSSIIPGIIDTRKGEFKKLDLDDSEYVGEDLAVLYHVPTNVVMIQRNRNAFGAKGLECYFQKALNSSEGVEIKLIPFTNNIDDLKKMFIRKIEVSFADVKIDDKSSSLFGMITRANKMKSLSTKISYSLGQGHNRDSLSAEEVEKFTKLREEDGFKRVNVSFKVSEDAPIEEVEFINGTLLDVEKFEYSKTNDINYTRIVDRMIKVFKLRKPYLENVFK